MATQPSKKLTLWDFLTESPNKPTVIRCPKAENAIKPQWSTGLRELSVGSIVEAVPSSQTHVPNNFASPEFKEVLRPIEGRILIYFYKDWRKILKIEKPTKELRQMSFKELKDEQTARSLGRFGNECQERGP